MADVATHLFDGLRSNISFVSCKSLNAIFWRREKLREILNLDESTQVEYKHFKTAIRDGILRLLIALYISRNLFLFGRNIEIVA